MDEVKTEDREIDQSPIIEKVHIPSTESQFIQEKSAKVSDDELIQIRIGKVVKFFKSNYNWVSYVVLALIVYLAVKIRSSNLGGLRDITTGGWTLGPDLDPFFFLRLAKYIVENGQIMAVDMMRYVPLGFDTSKGFVLHYYTIAWFHKLATYFGSESVTQSAAIFPVFFFALTVIAFFFMTRTIFLPSLGEKVSNVISLIASFFLAVMPPLLPRTIGGIPEKESSGFFFLFLSFYLFLAAWRSKHKFGKHLLALLAGVSTACMALIWGGFTFVFITIVPTVFMAFLLGKMDREKMMVYVLWVVSSFSIMTFFSARYHIERLLTSLTTGSAAILLLIMVVHHVIFNTKIKDYFTHEKLKNIPPKIISVAVTLIFLILVATSVYGFSYVPEQFNGVVNDLIKPAQTRLIQTVAENRQPYFTEWANNFGPHFRGFPLTFWLFFIGSIYLFWKMIKVMKKSERLTLTLAYVFFLVAVIFSRYSSSSKLNGENTTSLMFYGLGFLAFVLVSGFYYFKYYRNNDLDKLKEIDLGSLFMFSFIFLGIIAARAAVRVIMVLVAPASIMIAYFVVIIFINARKSKDPLGKFIMWAIAAMVIIATIFSGYTYYKVVSSQAPGHVPSVYTQQWQKAMQWVREETPQTAVFGHWWDYGYWLQSIGERATVLDGGNAISYWNHLMGRHALTGTNDRDAIEFLYAHDTSHFLIDSTDIGKYSAFSSIGSDVNYDRASFIPTFAKNKQATQEMKNSSIFIYQGGVGLDEDIVYENNGTKTFLPRGSTGVAAVLIERSNENGEIINQPQGVFVYQGVQYTLPLRYGFDREFKDYGEGVEIGFYLFPSITEGGGGFNIEADGMMLYLSERTVRSAVARLYLYKEDNSYFKLVHSEDDFFVGQLKAQNPAFGEYDIMHYRGLRGPIRIWEIEYPEDIELKEEYLSTVYPKELRIAT